MTSQPPSSPEGEAKPPRQRTPLVNFSQDATELDLWAFDDLESWDAPAASPPGKQLPSAPVAPVAPVASVASVASVDLTAPGAQDEFSPVPRAETAPRPLRPRLRLSKVEWVSFFGLCVILLAGAAAILGFVLRNLPMEPDRVRARDFPIKGSHLTIDSATSYWRVPVLTGSSADSVRRGTQLLPVLELSVSGGPAVIRVLFRNEDRVVVGDALTRTVRDGDRLKIPATAGFDNLGMHAAYRAGESKPWTIEVLEAASERATGKEIQPLFEMNISTDRR